MITDGMFKELVDNSDNIVIVTDPSFNITYVSLAIAKSFEVNPKTLLGRNVFDFVGADKINDWKACLSDRQSSFSEEISLSIVPGRKNYFDVHVTNLVEEGKERVALQLHDITQNKQREFDLKKSNEQLDQVIYKTTHDLKAPVRSALGLVDLAEKATDADKTQYIDLIKRSLLKLDAFIEEMNDFYRNEKLAVQRELVDIEKLLLDEVDSFLSYSARKNINIAFEVSGSIALYSDIIRLKTVLTNLLSNAIKYSDPKKMTPFIRIYVLINEENCQIRVVDNGIGIAPEFKEKIFELFFRGTDYAEGTGLGLFIVKDTIEKLKGTIDVDSTLGYGTTFTIRIPNLIYQSLKTV